MTLDDVRAVMAAAATIDPAAALMLRIAAVSGARRAELAALQWTDLRDGMLTIDSAIEIVRAGERHAELRDAATKTANTRSVTLDPDTVAAIEALRREREPYGPWMFGLGPELVEPRPHRVVVEASPHARRRRRRVAAARPPPLVGHRRHRPGPRRPHRRRPPRPRHGSPVRSFHGFALTTDGGPANGVPAHEAPAATAQSAPTPYRSVPHDQPPDQANRTHARLTRR